MEVPDYLRETGLRWCFVVACAGWAVYGFAQGVVLNHWYARDEGMYYLHAWIVAGGLTGYLLFEPQANLVHRWTVREKNTALYALGVAVFGVELVVGLALCLPHAWMQGWLDSLTTAIYKSGYPYISGFRSADEFHRSIVIVCDFAGPFLFILGLFGIFDTAGEQLVRHRLPRNDDEEG